MVRIMVKKNKVLAELGQFLKPLKGYSPLWEYVFKNNKLVISAERWKNHKVVDQVIISMPIEMFGFNNEPTTNKSGHFEIVDFIKAINKLATNKLKPSEIDFKFEPHNITWQQFDKVVLKPFTEPLPNKFPLYKLFSQCDSYQTGISYWQGITLPTIQGIKNLVALKSYVVKTTLIKWLL